MDAPRRRSIVLLTAASAVSAVSSLLAACSGGSSARSSTTRAGSASSGTTSPPASSSSAAATTTGPPAETGPDLLDKGAVNVLVCGSDSRTHAFSNGRSDVITVVQLTGDRKRVNLVSIARDCYVALPGGGHGKINAAYDSSGARGLATTVSRVLGGLKIDYTLETGFTAFVDIVDSLGGVTVNNRFASDSSHVAFAKGPITLVGPHSLVYVRERHGLPNGDLDRTERHRAMLTGMLARLSTMARQDPAALARLVPRLMANVRSSGLTTRQALSLVPVVSKMTTASVSSVMVPVARFDMISGASVDVINTRRTAELAAGLKRGDISGYVKRYGTSDAPTG
jgi:LCP family protein required for cell wall assembly